MQAMRKQMKMILKGRVSYINNDDDVIPIRVITESSTSHNESNACATTEKAVENVPETKLSE